MISVFDLFKIGIGPSSSHTVGPMIAAKRFRSELPAATVRVTVELFGSLAWTGTGHQTDVAICVGLLGECPAEVDIDAVPTLLVTMQAQKGFPLECGRWVTFDPQSDLLSNYAALRPLHSNAMCFRAFNSENVPVCESVYYSVGGGFVVREGEEVASTCAAASYEYESGSELLHLCRSKGLSISQLQLINETTNCELRDVELRLDGIANAMFACIERGLSSTGVLPGKLRVERRAKTLFEKLQKTKTANESNSHTIMDWVSAFAIAVNEENAAGGRVVTAPTNGAAGIVPAVLRYYRDFNLNYSPEGAREFLLTAAAFGSVIKRRASISGADVGCQGEVGSAASMAAAGFAAVLGGSPEQIENAAEIAIEHHLGMTCDPVGGLVQIPCIERNAMGANKAIAAASLALRGDGSHRVSFDQVVETMRQTGADMLTKYKETSRGGLAVNVTEC